MNGMNRSEDIKSDDGRYDDIIEFPHHVSAAHPHMTVRDRAAQFSPFAALTGYEAAVKETGRLTESHIELDENSKSILNEKLHIIREKIHEHPEISVTYFQPDLKKTGGTYVKITGAVRKIDAYKRKLMLEDGTEISIRDIIELEGGVLENPDCAR